MFNGTELADVSIMIGSTTVPAHRFVFYLQSRHVFNALEGEFEEVLAEKLQCEPRKEYAYVRVLQYLYSGDYEDDPSSLISKKDDPELHKHTRVWVSERLVECITEGIMLAEQSE
ncbi:hypothetical protein LTR48_006830 [Friedmanniomyces endolithicus]|uniref:BTB domain-containing protein n=1 Tax=Rachicladosporium monterosium TaxID=1507873 RepID=A0ABR0L9A7_9PEZI|nr:hypothetical protein LTR48_006830 [Friedmanniomyces endolithicus]KAK5144938.1 hypothetical protein LTR32_003222 [Rachicladosporium monterosium]